MDDSGRRHGHGRLLDARYRLVERLGQGGMGTVWRAHDEVMDREVAVKEPRLPEHVPDEERDVAYARLEREARAAARIGHSSVVTIHDVVSVDGRPWIVMELIRGRSLTDVLAEGALPPTEAARIALPVAAALAAAHDKKVLHRDVKPSNVMLGEDGRVVLTDFGIARIEGETSLTRTGTFVGAPEYMAPERVRGQAPGAPSDFFSLGVLLYAAVEGRSPFGRQTSQATLQAVLDVEPPVPSRAGELSDLIMRLLSKEPDRRPSSGEIISVLARVASRQTVREALPEKGGPRRWGRSAVAALPGFAAGLVVAAAVTAVVMMEPDGAGRPAAAPAGKPPAPAPLVPRGWTVRHWLGTSVAVPTGYKAFPLSDHGGGVAFQVEKGQAHRELLLLHWDVPDGSPEKRAGYWYRQYLRAKKFTDQQVTLSAAVVNGRQARVLTMTYRPDGVQLWRKRELFYNGGKGPWKLIVDWAVKNEQDTGGDELFENAVRSFRTE